MLGIAVMEPGPILGADAVRKAPSSRSDDRCRDLQAQFDAAIANGGGAAHAVAAESLRAEGVRLCNGGRHSQGARRLFLALKQIGVTPKF